MHRLPFIICLASLICTRVSAAPPTFDYLFPAGGQAGATVEVFAEGKYDRWPVRAWSSSKSLDIKPAKKSGKFSVAIAKDAEPGVHWIRLFDDQGASGVRPFLIGNLPERAEQEPNDEAQKPQVLDKSALVINARLEKPGDVDVFSLPLKKGQTLVAAVEAFKTLRSPMDAVLQVLSADGFVLEQNHDYRDLDPQIVFLAPSDGDYLVRIFAFPSIANSAIRFAGAANYVYRLTLTTEAFVDHAFPLAVSRVSPGAVELIGWNIPPELRKFPVTISDDTDMVKLFHPRLANVCFVRAEPHAVIANATATAEKPQPISLPVTICGRFERAGAVDVYQFAAKKGQKLSFRIEARTLGFLLDPILQVTDGTNIMLKPARATALGSDPVFDFVAPRDGQYFVEVHDLHKSAGPRHVYRLWAGTPLPDFDLKVASDRVTLAAGKPMELAVTIERRAGFKADVDVSVEGLPPGASAVSSVGPKGVSLRVSADAAFSGPIRIVGTAKDGERRARRARAALVELGTVTEDLWLSVTAK